MQIISWRIGMMYWTYLSMGDMPEKTQRIMDLYNVGEKEAVKMMADTDKGVWRIIIFTPIRNGERPVIIRCVWTARSLDITDVRRLLWSVVVILDEATAYTDPENEAILQNSIVKLGAGNTLFLFIHLPDQKIHGSFGNRRIGMIEVSWYGSFWKMCVFSNICKSYL